MPYALLIDDEIERRAFHHRILLDGGWQVDDVGDVAVALAAMRVRVPDIVLLGLFERAPVRGHARGVIQLLEEMLLDPWLRAVPRIVISAGERPVERSFALGLGAAAWLSAPVSPRRLLAAAWDHLSDSLPDGAPTIESR